MSGALCISIDLELAWGIWDRLDDAYLDNCAELETRIVTSLLGLFERHDISVTWAFVARLLERDDTACARTRHGERVWYAPHLIEAIRQSRVAHELGSHAYAHRYFSMLSRADAEAELASARRVHVAAGLPFDSLVFPRNDIAHLDVVAASGLRVYRGLDRGWFMTARRRGGKTAGRLAHLVDKALPIAPESIEPTRRSDGLVELPSSLLLLGRAGMRRVIPPRLMVEKAKRGLAAARDSGKTFHLWFHPSNFYDEPDVQLAVLGDILAAARASGVTISRMGDYAVAC